MRLSSVPDPPRRDISDLSHAEAVDHLRDLMDVTRDLCDAIGDYLGPQHPAPRPQLHIIRGGDRG